MKKLLIIILIVLILAIGVIEATTDSGIVGVGFTLVRGATDGIGVTFILIKDITSSATDSLSITFTLIQTGVVTATDSIGVSFTLLAEGVTSVTDSISVSFTLLAESIVSAFGTVVTVFTLESEEPTPPNTTACYPYSPNPPNAVSNVPITTNLTWKCDSEGNNYDIYFGVCNYNPPLKVVLNQSSKVYNPALQPGTCYCWRVVSHGTNGTTMSGKYWQFHTLANIELFEKDYVGIWKNYTAYNNSEEGCYQGETINMSELMSAIPAFYTGAIGSLFWLFLFGLPFVAIWIKSESVVIPTILGFMISGSMFFFLPIEYQGAAQILFYISVAGMLFSFFKSRY